MAGNINCVFSKFFSSRFSEEMEYFKLPFFSLLNPQVNPLVNLSLELSDEEPRHIKVELQAAEVIECHWHSVLLNKTPHPVLAKAYQWQKNANFWPLWMADQLPTAIHCETGTDTFHDPIKLSSTGWNLSCLIKRHTSCSASLHLTCLFPYSESV